MRNAKATTVFLLAMVVISLPGSRAMHGQAAATRQAQQRTDVAVERDRGIQLYKQGDVKRAVQALSTA